MTNTLKLINKKIDNLINHSDMPSINEPVWLRYFTQKIVIKDFNILKVIALAEITYLQAQSNYTFIHTEKGKILNSKTLKLWTEDINHDYFIRIHHSFLVNKMFIESISKSQNKIKLINGIELPISRKFKGIDKIFSEIHTI